MKKKRPEIIFKQIYKLIFFLNNLLLLLCRGLEGAWPLAPSVRYQLHGRERERERERVE
jgi:hypothetical protein